MMCLFIFPYLSQKGMSMAERRPVEPWQGEGQTLFLGQGDVPTSLPGTRVATTSGEMRPDRERVCCQAAVLLAAYKQSGESSLGHGVLEP